LLVALGRRVKRPVWKIEFGFGDACESLPHQPENLAHAQDPQQPPEKQATSSETPLDFDDDEELLKEAVVKKALPSEHKGIAKAVAKAASEKGERKKKSKFDTPAKKTKAAEIAAATAEKQSKGSKGSKPQAKPKCAEVAAATAEKQSKGSKGSKPQAKPKSAEIAAATAEKQSKGSKGSKPQAKPKRDTQNSRRHIRSRAYHQEEARAKREGCSDEVVKSRAREAARRSVEAL
jgi:hypothetical protein